MATRAMRPAMAAERRFYLGMAIAALAIVFTGFAPSWFLRGLVPAAQPLQPMSVTVVLHGLVFSAWTLLFAVQVGLMSAGRPDLHRKLGLLGFGLVVAMVLVGTVAALEGVARRSGPPVVPPLAWLAVPLLDVPVFAGLIGAGLARRREPQVHKRFMLAAMIGMLPPALGRLPWPPAAPFPLIVIGSQLLFMSALAVWDVKSRGRVHWVTWTATALLVGSWIVRLAIWQTGPWLAFAGWVSAPFTG